MAIWTGQGIRFHFVRACCWLCPIKPGLTTTWHYWTTLMKGQCQAESPIERFLYPHEPSGDQELATLSICGLQEAKRELSWLRRRSPMSLRNCRRCDSHPQRTYYAPRINLSGALRDFKFRLGTLETEFRAIRDYLLSATVVFVLRCRYLGPQILAPEVLLMLPPGGVHADSQPGTLVAS